ncbi:MAG: ribosomal protein L7/L12 [Cognaticolwellia sp.]|jgi:ribosomal protein L7/L12
MEEKIVELLQGKKVAEAIELYVHEYGVTWSEAKSIIDTYKSELSLLIPNHRSDTAFPLEEVNMLSQQIYCGDIDGTLEYLQDKYGIEEPEAKLVLGGIEEGNIYLPSYDEMNTEEIIQLLKNHQKITAITRYRELYDVNIRMARKAVEKIETIITL